MICKQGSFLPKNFGRYLQTVFRRCWTCDRVTAHEVRAVSEGVEATACFVCGHVIRVVTVGHTMEKRS